MSSLDMYVDLSRKLDRAHSDRATARRLGDLEAQVVAEANVITLTASVDEARRALGPA